MTTMSEAHSRNAAYWGESGDWLIVISVHRDSDCLSRSNYDAVKEILGAIEGAVDHLSEERSSHWAVGWVDCLIIDPSWDAGVARVGEIRRGLEDYPVVDEEKWSQYEQEEADEVWKNCYDWEERVDYIRKYRSQFYFHDFRELLSVVRGEYFNGYAGELIQ